MSEVETAEYCVRCAVKHVQAAQDALKDAIKSEIPNSPVRPDELDELLGKLLPLSETIKECRRWNIPEQHIAECSKMLGLFQDREISPEEFSSELTRWTGKKYKVVREAEKVTIKAE